MAIHCPWCGSPVTICGDSWECGWCGDFGGIGSLGSSERKKLRDARNEELNDKLYDLEWGTVSILNGMEEFMGKGTPAELLSLQLALYGITYALLPTENQTKENLQLLNAFFQRYPFCTVDEVWEVALEGNPAFEDQFAITKQQLGSFWNDPLSKLPPHKTYQAWPDWLYKIVSGLSEVESFFSGEDSFALFEKFQEILNSHWSTYHITHPNYAALKDAVQRWDFDENELACRDLLIAAFPDAVRSWSVEELLEMDTMELLGKVGERKPEAGIQMMKFLLDTAECHLQEPEAAEQLLGNDLYELFQNQAVQPKLLAQLKTDEHLVRQLFQSAYAGDLQEDILEACDWFGELALKEHLQTLLSENPYCEEFD